MKIKFILLAFVQFAFTLGFSQYIGVKARYTDTRLVDNSPEPPSRENRLVLSFFEVSPTGVWTVANLLNYDLWMEKEGLQFGNLNGGVLDSVGNNYPGYNYTAPRVVSYYNTLGTNYFDCIQNYGAHYVVNGPELDCGFIRVSHWEEGSELFTAPNINLPYYEIGHPYYFTPGNLNFTYYDLGAGPPYNLYNFHCGGPLQLIMKGLLSQDTGMTTVLPVRFANVRAELRDTTATLEFSNMTESDIALYDVERSIDGINWGSLMSIIPLHNDGSRADYRYTTPQTLERCYYRIKATENTGSFFYSNIILLRRDPGLTGGPGLPPPQLSIYPNPVTTGTFHYNLSNAVKGRYISIVVNAEGKQLRQRLIMHNGGNLTGQVDLTGLPAGMYQFVIRGEREKFSQKIMYVR